MEGHQASQTISVNIRAFIFSINKKRILFIPATTGTLRPLIR